MKIFDVHFHIINPDFPLVENNGYLPPRFTIDDYKAQTSQYDVVGGAVVSGSFQAFDQGYLIDALDKLGEGYFGVANIPFDMSDKELEQLNKQGVRAVRFNLKRGGSEKIEQMEYLSDKLQDEYGWHTELYMDSKDIRELSIQLSKLPAYSIDHLGLSADGLLDLYNLVEKGVHVKATGFGRVDFDPVPVMQKIYEINPNALMFGTDLPSTRAKVPFSDADVQLIVNNFSDGAQHRIFYQNAADWYSRIVL